MLKLALLLGLVFVFNSPDSANAICCGRGNSNWMCGDGTQGTPCCATGGCNIFCCNCAGRCRTGSFMEVMTGEVPTQGLEEMAKFRAIDANGDQKIDFAEALAFVGGIGDGELNRLPRGFTELDEDGDGMISPMEFDQDISEEEFMKAELEDADEELTQEELAQEELADTIVEGVEEIQNKLDAVEDAIGDQRFCLPIIGCIGCQELLYGITNNGGGNNVGSYKPTSRPTYRPTSGPTRPTPGPTYRPTWRPNDRPTNWQWGNTNGFRNGQNKKVGATRAQSSDKESGDAVSFVSQ